jgi:hypothetical protein
MQQIGRLLDIRLIAKRGYGVALSIEDALYAHVAFS